MESSIGRGGKTMVIDYSTDATPPTIGRGK
jgi:hypothetical protein